MPWVGPAPEGRSNWVEVDLAALRANLALARRLAPPHSPLLAVVKANAYGHGAVPVARTLLEEGAALLAVATWEEGRELREAGILAPVLVMGRMVPAEAEDALRWGLEIALPGTDSARLLSARAAARGKRARVHLKVDTGMARLGVPWEKAEEAVREVLALPGLELAGVFTHFANADLADGATTRLQMDRFEALHRRLSPHLPGVLFHMPNSAALLTSRVLPGMGVRPGIMLYGAAPGPGVRSAELRPVLSWKCRVIQVREVPAGTGISYGHTFTTRRPSLIAAVSTGYADGFPRALSNRGRVLVRGRKVPVVGRVCMDMTMVDVTEVPGAAPSDEVTLLGNQGREAVPADELADLCGTISYEIFCAISRRVPRFFREGDAP